MASEDIVFSVDYWFCQRQATETRLIAVVAAPSYDSGLQSLPCGACRQKRRCSCLLESSRRFSASDLAAMHAP